MSHCGEFYKDTVNKSMPTTPNLQVKILFEKSYDLVFFKFSSVN